MGKEELLILAEPYGVREINFGGCLVGQRKGFKGAMRPSGHAHCSSKSKDRGLICFKGGIKHAISPLTQRTTQLFWHEVAHIYRRSWTEKQCNQWAWHKARE